MDVVDRVPKLGYRAAHLRQLMRGKLTDHKRYIVQRGEDMLEVRDWVWEGASHATPGQPAQEEARDESGAN